MTLNALKRASLRTLARIPGPSLLFREPKFVIIGTGRSGTGYISRLLTEAGIRTGHEDWWNPRQHRKPMLKGDASWCATFTVDDYDGHIFHQVRDPIRVIRSLAAVEAGSGQWSTAHGQYRARWVEFSGDRIVDAMRIVDTWVSKAEAEAEWTYRLEDLTPDLVKELAHRAGFRLTHGQIHSAFSAIPDRVNTKSRYQRQAVSWADLPGGDMKKHLLLHAEKYGYL